MNKFDVRVYAIRRRPARRRPFEVRWQAAGRARSKSFITRALADSYRAELIRAARQGLEFDPATGEPVLWAGPEPVTVTWYQHAAAYAAMKWPGLAAHSRASLADALATVTPALTRTAAERPQAAALRTALYQHAFNPARPATDAATARILDWVQQASLPVARLADPVVLRQALDALTLRLDGVRAAANTVIRKRAVFHGALGYAVETGLLESNPADRISWRVPRACRAADPTVVASPAQAEGSESNHNSAQQPGIRKKAPLGKGVTRAAANFRAQQHQNRQRREKDRQRLRKNHRRVICGERAERREPRSGNRRALPVPAGRESGGDPGNDETRGYIHHGL
ncbi:MAG: hypothetical protein ACLPKE_00550, partial [Streptosporangiaceae bacterium]